MTDTSEEAARRRAAEQLSAATAAMVTQGNIEAERADAEKKAKKEAKRKVGSCCVMRTSLSSPCAHCSFTLKLEGCQAQGGFA